MSTRPVPQAYPSRDTADHERRARDSFERAREEAQKDIVSPPELRTAATFERG